MLFDEKCRTDARPRMHTETEWEYLDQSGRAEAVKVRDFLEYCFSKFPEKEQIELKSRIRSNDVANFKSAIFEIFLFSLFNSLGWEVEIHPKLDGDKEARPDFLIHTSDGSPVYVEAVLASDYNAAEISARKRTSVVLNSLEKVESPNFFIGFHADGHPENPPSGRRIRREVETWLASLDPDQVDKTLRSTDEPEFPEKIIEFDDWRIEITAFPIKPSRRGKGQRIVGAISHAPRWINVWEPIRDAVCAKGNKYGDLPHPFVIATNVDSMGLERIDEMQALFGEEEFVFDRNSPGKEPRMKRAPNGAWNGPKGPQYTRVSGAWIFNNLSLWNAANCGNTLYVNPFARNRLPKEFLLFPRAIPDNGNMEWLDGASLGKLLGLPADWPSVELK